MGTLVIKNVPEPLHDKLKRQAERNHRSVNEEVIAILEQAFGLRVPPKLSPPPNCTVAFGRSSKPASPTAGISS